MIGTLIASVATGEVKTVLDRVKRTVLAFTISGLCFLIAIIFLMIAGTLWLAHRLGPIEATLSVGIGFLVVGIVVLILHRLTSSTKSKVAKRRRDDDLRKAAIATGIAILPTLLRGRTGRAALLAPAAGAVAYVLYRENSGRRRRRSSLDD